MSGAAANSDSLKWVSYFDILFSNLLWITFWERKMDKAEDFCIQAWALGAVLEDWD